MSDHRVLICCVGIGGWYGKGIARLIQQFDLVSPGYEIHGWVNVLPPGAPKGVTDGRRDYTGYCAKPFALKECMDDDATIAILMDAAFYPIADIYPMVDHIARHGYYLCDNGNQVGEWTSDACLEEMGVTRDEAMGMRECSSYCVGLNFKRVETPARALLLAWCRYAQTRAFVGFHENSMMPFRTGHQRNPGFVSSDARVRGHRHDQSVLSILAHQFGMNHFSPRPYLTGYKSQVNERTVLCNDGLG